MPKLNVPPTKSKLLGLKHQLAFAEEGYDLLDQKRRILIFELLSRLQRAHQVERALEAALRRAHAALCQALLDAGSAALDRVALGVRLDPAAVVAPQPLMGLRLPRAQAQVQAPRAPLGSSDSSASADLAQRQFTDALPLVAELAGLENAILRLARELRKTQRRCNALSKIFIPAHRETIHYIASALEERERESFTILKMIRQRYGSQWQA